MKNLGLSGTIVVIVGALWLVGSVAWVLMLLGLPSLLVGGIIASGLVGIWMLLSKKEAPPLVMRDPNWRPEDEEVDADQKVL